MIEDSLILIAKLYGIHRHLVESSLDHIMTFSIQFSFLVKTILQIDKMLGYLIFQRAHIVFEPFDGIILIEFKPGRLNNIF